MDRETHRCFADASLKARRKEDARQNFLDFRERMPQLAKDYREIYARTVACLYPNDSDMRAAYAPYRKDGIDLKEVEGRPANILNALVDARNLDACAEVFDALAESREILCPGAPRSLPSRGTIPLADLARHCACTRVNDNARVALARQLYRRNGTLTKAATALFEGRDWLRKHVDNILGDARPQQQADSVRASLHRCWQDVKSSVRELQLAFVFFSLTLVLIVVLGVVAFVVGQKAARAVGPSPVAELVAVSVAEPDVFEKLRTEIAAHAEQLKDTLIIVAPHARDDSDKRLAEIMAPIAQHARLVPWFESRRVLGEDVPSLSSMWMSPAELTDLAQAIGEGECYIYRDILYVDVEPLPEAQARLSLFGSSPSRLVCAVTGKAPGVLPIHDSEWFVVRSRTEFCANHTSRMAELYARQAYAASRTDVERGRALLLQGQLLLCRDKRTKASEAFARAYVLIGDADRKTIPDPLLKSIAKEAQTPEERVRGLIELRSTADKEARHAGTH